jgi:uncharacterized protein (TIGR02246 family)
MRSVILFVAWAILCVVGVLLAEPKAGNKPAPAAKGSAGASASAANPAAGREQDEKAIRDAVARLTKAYNGGDAAGVASLYTTDGEMIDGVGNQIQGRPAIEAEMAATFKAHPTAKLEVAIDTIRFLGASLAVEESVSTVTYEPGGPAQAGRYVVTYVKQDGKWLSGIVRELPDQQSGMQELEQLAWLVGDWVDESHEALVKTSYRWSDDHRFIVGDFAMHIGGREAMNGTHRIGWDPLAHQIRSWAFDSEGGFGESLWTVVQNDPKTGQPMKWVVKMSGVSHDGAIGSATHTYTRVGDDRYSFQSRDRIVGGKLTEDTPEIIVARAAPHPGK